MTMEVLQALIDENNLLVFLDVVWHKYKKTP